MLKRKEKKRKREKQTQQKEESGKLSAVTGIWIVMEML